MKIRDLIAEAETDTAGSNVVATPLAPKDNVVATPLKDPNADKTSDEFIKKGPPFTHPGVVRALQYALDKLGYSVGSTGFDGKFGPRTAKAIAAFKKDYRVTPSSGDHFGLPTIRKVEAIAAGTIPRVAKPSSTGNQETKRSGTGPVNDDPNFQAPGYPPEMTRAVMERIITKEASLRGMDPGVAIKIFRAEGAGSYQSSVARSGNGSLGGREASFGPYQLYIGGGLGNDYQKATGRDLTKDNTVDGITNQIRFALDMAVKNTWQPWYGRGPAGVGKLDGLSGAKYVRNWS
jgi:peptidoglycan hydrolase-like protein with peptidoglycan-binding domain|tara:strand:+ start:131 stop:1003 length:873 start_codon:yes stop_codon:yes gene_type:complete